MEKSNDTLSDSTNVYRGINIFKTYCDECGKLAKEHYFRILHSEDRYRPIQLLKEGEKKDIILTLGFDWPTGNVPRRLLFFANFYTWGYKGYGPTDLAMNILYHFTDGDLNFALMLADKFTKDVIQHLPNKESVILSAAHVLRWIEDNKHLVGHPDSRELRGRHTYTGYVWCDDDEVKTPELVNRGAGKRGL